MKTRLGNLKVVTNTENKGQANPIYTCVWVKDQSGNKIPLLFTDVELSNAIHRAAKNPEDLTQLSLISKILD